MSDFLSARGLRPVAERVSDAPEVTSASPPFLTPDQIISLLTLASETEVDEVRRAAVDMVQMALHPPTTFTDVALRAANERYGGGPDDPEAA